MSNSSTGSSDARGFLLAALGALLALTALSELWLRTQAPKRDAIAGAIVLARSSTLPGIILGHSHTYSLEGRLAGYANLSVPGANIPTMRALAGLRVQGATVRYAILASSPDLLSVASLGRGDSGLREWRSLSPLFLMQPPLASRLIPSLLRPAAGAEAEMEALDVGDRWSEVDALRRDIWTRARVEQQRPGPARDRRRHLAQYGEMLAMLESAGARTCMLRTPVTPAYLAAAAALPEFDTAEHELRALADRHRAQWIDFRAFEPPLALSEFLNQDHVNAAGAARFATWVQQRCEESAP
ncbi:MAG: hypothetical protein ACPHN2_03015 [Sinimarinibacterium flocculans]|uniref:hypothetical protein n=1 Tax=Sinimarinibacterium flocculans TaxID=985250 RepID=UPI002EBB596F|nr:hypothetical protein [Pseudomonadota bacterium]